MEATEGTRNNERGVRNRLASAHLLHGWGLRSAKNRDRVGRRSEMGAN